MENFAGALPLILIAMFALLLFSRARTARRESTALLERLQPGLEVMTTAGLYGTVAAVEDTVVELEVSPGVRLRFAKQAIARVVPRAEPVASNDETDSHGEQPPRVQG